MTPEEHVRAEVGRYIPEGPTRDAGVKRNLSLLALLSHNPLDWWLLEQIDADTGEMWLVWERKR